MLSQKLKAGHRIFQPLDLARAQLLNIFCWHIVNVEVVSSAETTSLHPPHSVIKQLNLGLLAKSLSMESACRRDLYASSTRFAKACSGMYFMLKLPKPWPK